MGKKNQNCRLDNCSGRALSPVSRENICVYPARVYVRRKRRRKEKLFSLTLPLFPAEVTENFLKGREVEKALGRRCGCERERERGKEHFPSPPIHIHSTLLHRTFIDLLFPNINPSYTFPPDFTPPGKCISSFSRFRTRLPFLKFI